MLQSIGVAHAVGEQFIHLTDRSDFRGHLCTKFIRTRSATGKNSSWRLRRRCLPGRSFLGTRVARRKSDGFTRRSGS